MSLRLFVTWAPRGVAVALTIAAGLLGTSCASQRQLAHVGYTKSSSKVWYHWVDNNDKQFVIVCDVLPNGSEINCRENQI